MREGKRSLTGLVRRNRLVPPTPARLADDATVGRLSDAELLMTGAEGHDVAPAGADDGQRASRLHPWPAMGTEQSPDVSSDRLGDVVVPMGVVANISPKLRSRGRGSWSGDYPTAS
jgi:hypothetical protein